MVIDNNIFVAIPDEKLDVRKRSGKIGLFHSGTLETADNKNPV